MKISAVWWLFVSGIRKEYTRSIVLAVVLACFALVLGAFVAPTGSVAAKGLQGNDAVSTLVITPAVGPNAQPFNAQTEEAVRADARLDSVTPQFTVGLVPNDERLKSEGVDPILWAKSAVPGAHPDWESGAEQLGAAEIGVPADLSGTDLRFLLGDDVVFRYQERLEGSRVRGADATLKVSRIFGTDQPNNDGPDVAYINADDARRFKAAEQGVPPDQAVPEKIFAHVAPEADLADVQKDWQDRGYQVTSLAQVVRMMDPIVGAAKNLSVVLNVVVAVVLFVLAFTLGAVICSSRRTFFGIAKSFGDSSGKIAAYIFLESACVAGVVAVAAVVLAMVVVGVAAFVDATVGLPHALSGAWSLPALLATPTVAVVVGSCAAIPFLAVLRAWSTVSRSDPLELLREE